MRVRVWTVAIIVSLAAPVAGAQSVSSVPGPTAQTSTFERGYVTLGVSRFGLSFHPVFTTATWKGSVAGPSVAAGFVIKPAVSLELDVTLPGRMAAAASSCTRSVAWDYSKLGTDPAALGVDIREISRPGACNIHPTSALGITASLAAHVQVQRRLTLGLRVGSGVRRMKASLVPEEAFVEEFGVYTVRTRPVEILKQSSQVVLFGAELRIALSKHIAVVPEVRVEHAINLCPCDSEGPGITITRQGVGVQVGF